MDESMRLVIMPSTFKVDFKKQLQNNYITETIE